MNENRARANDAATRARAFRDVERASTRARRRAIGDRRFGVMTSRRSVGHGLGRSVMDSVGRSWTRSVGQGLGRSIDRSVGQSPSVDRSVGQSPSISDVDRSIARPLSVGRSFCLSVHTHANARDVDVDARGARVRQSGRFAC